jgi:hypothetical protein
MENNVLKNWTALLAWMIVLNFFCHLNSWEEKHCFVNNNVCLYKF